MPINSDLIPLIQKYTYLNQIDARWVKAIILTESGGDRFAIRYEANYQYLYKVEICAKKCGATIATELAAQRMSWGLGQLMGAVVREQGHTDTLGALLDPEININHMCLRIKALIIGAGRNPDDVFAAYNGGLAAIKKFNNSYINQSYVDKVNKNLALV